jgi:predicted nucleic acid-binding protein
VAGWLLDTNAVSALMRWEPQVVRRVTRLPIGDQVAISVVNHAEVRHGLLRMPDGRRKRTLEREYERLLAIPIDLLDATPEVGEVYAGLHFALEQRGVPRADNDLWIASAALHHNLILVTDDDHFTLMPDLRVVNWLREPSS